MKKIYILLDLINYIEKLLAVSFDKYLVQSLAKMQRFSNEIAKYLIS